jgi:ZIP family zinc transporter
MSPIALIVIIAFTGPILGSAIGILRRPNFAYVCCMLCFAAGVMLAISFLELIPESIRLSSPVVAVHNIPEGICTSASYFHASGNRLGAFVLSSATALPILLGFFIATRLFEAISPAVVGLLISATAGLMIYITVDELIPNSCAGENHQTIFSFMTGAVLVVLLQLV